MPPPREGGDPSVPATTRPRSRSQGPTAQSVAKRLVGMGDGLTEAVKQLLSSDAESRALGERRIAGISRALRSVGELIQSNKLTNPDPKRAAHVLTDGDGDGYGTDGTDDSFHSGDGTMQTLLARDSGLPHGGDSENFLISDSSQVHTQEQEYPASSQVSLNLNSEPERESAFLAAIDDSITHFLRYEHS